MNKTPTINKDLCLGCGTCMAICPQGFGMGDDGKATVLGEVEEAELKTVISGCPAGAIGIKE
jgi:ferredoxin